MPGYYSVILRDYKIHAELSATGRTGIHRYRFPEKRSSHFIVDLTHGYDDSPGVVNWSNLHQLYPDAYSVFLVQRARDCNQALNCPV